MAQLSPKACQNVRKHNSVQCKGNTITAPETYVQQVSKGKLAYVHDIIVMYVFLFSW